MGFLVVEAGDGARAAILGLAGENIGRVAADGRSRRWGQQRFSFGAPLVRSSCNAICLRRSRDPLLWVTIPEGKVEENQSIRVVTKGTFGQVMETGGKGNKWELPIAAILKTFEAWRNYVASSHMSEASDIGDDNRCGEDTR